MIEKESFFNHYIFFYWEYEKITQHKQIGTETVSSQLVFDEDFYGKVKDKELFLKELSEYLKSIKPGLKDIELPDAHPGSIKVDIETDSETLEFIQEYIKNNGVTLPSTGHLKNSTWYFCV